MAQISRREFAAYLLVLSHQSCTFFREFLANGWPLMFHRIHWGKTRGSGASLVAQTWVQRKAKMLHAFDAHQELRRKGAGLIFVLFPDLKWLLWISRTRSFGQVFNYGANAENN